MLEINPVGAFRVFPFINRHMGRVYDVTHCYNLGKKMRSFILIKCLVYDVTHCYNLGEKKGA